MHSKNKSGPKIEPCGTPDVTDNQLDLAPSMTTYCFLPVKGMVNCQNSRDKGPPECNNVRG